MTVINGIVKRAWTRGSGPWTNGLERAGLGQNRPVKLRVKTVGPFRSQFKRIQPDGHGPTTHGGKNP